MLDLKLVRQNAELKSKDNSYTWIAPDRVIAMIDEIERLREKPLPTFRCDGCDNGVELEWEYCAWCGRTKDWVLEKSDT